MAELVGHMQQEYPDSKAASRGKGPKDYCVGGAFLRFIGVSDSSFPSGYEIGNKLVELGVPEGRARRPVPIDTPEAKRITGADLALVGDAITIYNDVGDFKRAWELLQESFEDCPVAIKAAMSAHNCAYDTPTTE